MRSATSGRATIAPAGSSAIPRIYAVAAVICLIAGMVLVAMPRIQQTLGDRAVDEQARSVSQTAALFPESSRQSVIQSAMHISASL